MNDHRVLLMPCGGSAVFDESSGISFRCVDCGAVVGSMGQPRECKDEAQKYDTWKSLGGKGWDYRRGAPEKRDNKSKI